jgi:hypothetical protein
VERQKMKEEELIKKLESVNLPQVEVESHRRRIRMALLRSQYFEEHPGRVAASKPKIKGGIDISKRVILDFLYQTGGTDRFLW